MLWWLYIAVAWAGCDDFSTPGELSGKSSLAEAVGCLDDWGLDTLVIDSDWESSDTSVVELDQPLTLYGDDESDLVTLPQVDISDEVALYNVTLAANESVLSYGSLDLGYGARVLTGGVLTAVNIQLEDESGVPLLISDGEVQLVNAFGTGGSGASGASGTLPAIAQLGGTLTMESDASEPGSCSFTDWVGAGVLRTVGAESVTLRGCDFSSSTATIYSDWEGLDIADGEASGGAISVRGDTVMTDVLIEDCLFVEHQADIDGGAVALSDVFVEVRNTSFLSNIAVGSGGALSVTSNTATSSTLVLEDNSFETNLTTTGEGGAIVLRDTEATGSGDTFEESSANYGGVVALFGGSLTTTGWTVDNASASFGSVAYVDGSARSTTLVLDADVQNVDSVFDGGVVVDEGVATLSGSWSSFTAANAGGVVANYAGEVTLQNLEVDGTNGYASTGGVAYATGPGASLVIDGGVYTGLSVEVSGGLLRAERTDVAVRGVVVTGGAGTVSGGGAIEVSMSDLTIEDSRFSDFDVEQYGGVLVTTLGTVDIAGSWFEQSSARNGGALYFNGTDVDIRTSHFENLSAERSGGAIYLEDGTMDLHSSFFCRTQAPSGAALKVDASGAGRSNVDGVGLTEVNSAKGPVLDLFAGSLNWQNTTLVQSSAFPFYQNDDQLLLVNNIVTDGEMGVNGAGSTTGRYNLWFDVDTIATGAKHALPGTGTIRDEDPLLTGSTDPCDVLALLPLAGSPVVDAGDPDMEDQDGSRSDIGAFGGENALWDYVATWEVVTDTGDVVEPTDTDTDTESDTDTAAPNDTGNGAARPPVDEVRLYGGCLGSIGSAWLLLPLVGWRRRSHGARR